MKIRLSVVVLVLLLVSTQVAGSQRDFSEPKVIWAVRGADHVNTADLDGDGDLDVLSASANDNTIAWYENVDRQGSFGPQQVITTAAQGARRAAAADLDGDGDSDVISASYNDDKIAWYENTDGLGTFGPERIITTEADGAICAVAADLDGDTDLDVIWAAWEVDQVAWAENTDGLGTLGPPQVITSEADGAVSIFVADLDGNNRLDVVIGSNMNNEITWYANMDERGRFVFRQVITASVQNLMNTFGADLDGDGDIDVLSASSEDNKVAWYPNTDGHGTFGEQQVIVSDASDAFAVTTADLDGDGDLDVVWGASRANTVAWQLNNLGVFGPIQVITTDARGVESVTTADLDGDGDPDVLSASWQDGHIAWYQNNG